MAYPIRYSTRAYNEYESILDYIVESFGIEIAAKTDNYFEEVIHQISINPFLYPYSDKKKNLRRCVIKSTNNIILSF